MSETYQSYVSASTPPIDNLIPGFGLPCILVSLYVSQRKKWLPSLYWHKHILNFLIIDWLSWLLGNDEQHSMLLHQLAECHVQAYKALKLIHDLHITRDGVHALCPSYKGLNDSFSLTSAKLLYVLYSCLHSAGASTHSCRFLLMETILYSSTFAFAR